MYTWNVLGRLVQFIFFFFFLQTKNETMYDRWSLTFIFFLFKPSTISLHITTNNYWSVGRFLSFDNKNEKKSLIKTQFLSNEVITVFKKQLNFPSIKQQNKNSLFTIHQKNTKKNVKQNKCPTINHLFVTHK